MHLSDINMVKGFSRLFDKTQSTETINHEQDLLLDEYESSRSISAILQETQNATDEMSSLLSQFMTRNRYERRKNSEIERNESFLDEVSDSSDGKFTDVKRNNNSDIAYFLQKIRQLFPDDSDLVLVLRELLGKKDLEKAEKEKIQEFLREIESKVAPKDIRGAINCALKAKVYSKKLKTNPKFLRRSYRGFIQNSKPIALYYLDWVGMYGFDHRQLVLEYIEASLIDDIHSLDPSCSSTEFGDLLANLTSLKKLQSIENAFFSQLLKDTVAAKLNINQQDWLVLLISVISDSYNFTLILKDVLSEKIDSLDITSLARLVQLIYRLCVSLPHEIFTSEDSGEGMLKQILELQNKLSSLEEQANRGLSIDRETINSLLAD
ncbi:YopN family type III secretion system gatekeeper subunit [Escherichia coli]|uniref:type III secretion system gatekeeper subunit SctW n=1 Tax=Escherichia coli TaxID=562 RepID=UPI00058A2C25|nr:type III secretion system gatekeeper subunit SctW [Escherichia coli]EAC1404459.1 YopN family type III secretion system gatekeeper subunit [Escherichia coli]EEW6031702.1 YopN family type III secretion system gatekeeper subunit [Escherichia coli]EFC4873403.1 YopN family type III secretion system gatekeeper subunit [Escherichia coli]EFN9261332.1 YopN family type III secretion system gatekeeper subunit [Escherichia coli]EGK3604406.1 YopN family type III secretion system gatekeeper subunit [Esch